MGSGGVNCAILSATSTRTAAAKEGGFSMKELIWRWGPALIVMALIFTASGTPGQELPDFGAMDLMAKKGGHMFGYALLGIAYLRGVSYRKSISPGHCILAAILACLYASTDEFHQRFTPNRTPCVQDVLIDAVGAAIGVSIWPLIRSRLIAFLPWTKTPSQG